MPINKAIIINIRVSWFQASAFYSKRKKSKRLEERQEKEGRKQNQFVIPDNCGDSDIELDDDVLDEAYDDDVLDPDFLLNVQDDDLAHDSAPSTSGKHLNSCKCLVCLFWSPFLKGRVLPVI